MKHTFGKQLVIALGLMATFHGAMAAKKSYPKVYPFIPQTLTGIDGIYFDVTKVTEDRKFLKNLNDIVNLGLDKEAKTPEKPWTSSYLSLIHI
mgnify:CR=1 FL=1